MRIELPFVYSDEDYKTFEEVVKFIKDWARSAAKNRRFKGVTIPKVEESPQTGWPIVTFDGEEDALRKLFNYYMGLTKRDKHITADFDSVVVSESTNDGWDGDEAIQDSGLFDFIDRFEKFSYAMLHNTRTSAKWGSTNKDLAAYCNELGDELKEIAKEIDETIGESEKEKLNEIDYGKNNTRRKHFVASDKPTRYWIAAAEQNPENITHFVKIDWATRRPICVPTSVVSDEARSDMKPFMTTDPGKIHTVALMASKLFPKFYLNVQEENYRETAKSRWTNTARPHGMGIEWDPKTKHWFGNMEEVLGPATPIAKKDDLGYDKKTDSKPKSKYEQMDPRKLPYEKSRLEKEIERTEKTVEDIRKSGNKSGKLEKFEKDLAQLKTELEEVNKLLA